MAPSADDLLWLQGFQEHHPQLRSQRSSDQPFYPLGRIVRVRPKAPQAGFHLAADANGERSTGRFAFGLQRRRNPPSGSSMRQGDLNRPSRGHSRRLCHGSASSSVVIASEWPHSSQKTTFKGISIHS